MARKRRITSNNYPVLSSSRALTIVPKPVIDYPLENETIDSRCYTIRVNAPEARLVRLAINQGEWLECRPAVGYWWFDWSNYAPGEYEIIACADHAEGRETVSTTAHCLVKE